MDTANLGHGAGTWFEMGQRAGGRLSGVGSSLKVLVDTLKEDKALKQEKDLIEYKAQTEAKYRDKSGILANNLDVYKKLYDLGIIDSIPNDVSGNMPSTTPSLGSGQVSSTSSTPLNSEDYVQIPEYERTLGGMRVKGYKSEPTTKKKVEDKIAETQAAEYAKPYSETEAGLISKADTISPEIDKLISLIGEKGSGKTGPTANIYGPSPWSGANRIAAYLRPSAGSWTSPLDNARRAITFGKGREAGILLQKIRTLAFGEGGKALTPSEQDIALAAIDPTHKTEQQWIDGLKYAKDLIQSKANLVRKKTPVSLKGNQVEEPVIDLKQKYGLE